MDFSFENDSEAVSVARDITSALRSLTEEDYIEPERYQLGGSEDVAVIEKPEVSKKTDKARAIFKELATKLAKDVDLSDVADDVAAHEQLQRMATFGQIPLPVLQIGTHDIPCLFSPEVTEEILGKDENYLDDLEGKLVRAAEQSFGRHQLRVESREKINDLFFGGLEPYLATRIGGKRWLATEGKDQGGGGGMFEFLKKGGAGGGQWWDVINTTPGLVLYWANQYGVRVPAVNIGGKTRPPKPFKVFLRPGNGHIGADSKPNQEIDWDESLICVPSMNPIFATNRF